MILLLAVGCRSGDQQKEKIRIIIDSDANNEVDDQHAIAYALFSGDRFDVEGITVNRTFNGGDVEQQKAEAVRVVKLCSLYPQIRVYKGANGSYRDIVGHLDEPGFDGEEAVDFIIQRALASDPRTLWIVPVGKLTNIALAIKKAPEIIPHIRVLWLGTNYPEDRMEYNFENDTTAVNPVLNSDLYFEIAVVRNGDTTGTAAVVASTEEIREKMSGKGPHIPEPVRGRHGGMFDNFGDYSVSLFEHTGNDRRALYDMAAVAILKNPAWARADTIGAPEFVNGHWVRRPDNLHRIIIREYFDKDAILKDFFNTMAHYHLTGRD